MSPFDNSDYVIPGFEFASSRAVASRWHNYHTSSLFHVQIRWSLLVMLSVLFSYNVLPPLGSSSMLTSCCILSRCAGVEVTTLPSEVALIDQEAEQQKSKQSALRSVHVMKSLLLKQKSSAGNTSKLPTENRDTHHDA